MEVVDCYSLIRGILEGINDERISGVGGICGNQDRETVGKDNVGKDNECDTGEVNDRGRMSRITVPALP